MHQSKECTALVPAADASVAWTSLSLSLSFFLSLSLSLSLPLSLPLCIHVPLYYRRPERGRERAFLTVLLADACMARSGAADG